MLLIAGAEIREPRVHIIAGTERHGWRRAERERPPPSGRLLHDNIDERKR